MRLAQIEDEGAIQVDRHLAQQVTVVVYHRDPGTGLGGADQLGTAVVDAGNDDGRRRYVDCRDGTDRRHVVTGVGEGYLHLLAIELGGVQADAEGAVGSDRGGADLRCTHIDAHRGTRFANPGQHIACRIEPQLGCSRGGREVRRLHADGRADVAGRVGLQYRQHLVVDLCRRQHDAEAAVGQHRSGSQYATGGVAHDHGGAGLTQASDHTAVGVDRHLGERGRWGEVRGLQGRCCRHVTGGVGLGEAEQLGIAQCRVQGNGEVPAGIDDGAADRRAARVGHGHLGADFAAAGQGDTIAGNRQVARRRRWCSVWRGDGAGGRLVAGRIGQKHL